jgi:pimeloyl-ACP methyl ester carboxylesterase
MAKLMSKKTKETVQTIAVLVVGALLIIFYILIPLLTVSDMTARENRDEIEDGSYEPVNDPAYFVENGFTPDTFSVVSQDNIRLAALYFSPDSARFEQAGATVILIHPDDTDRTAMLPYLNPILDSGWAAVAYDQRASGLSGGIYHFAGDYEADDLVDIIAYLNIHDRLRRPLLLVGYQLGGDAAINASREEQRIDAIAAVNPYLTSARWLEAREKKEGAVAIPFHNRVYFWWFRKISGFPYSRTDADDLLPVEIDLLILADKGNIASDAYQTLKEISPAGTVDIEPIPDSQAQVLERIMEFLSRSARKTPSPAGE